MTKAYQYDADGYFAGEIDDHGLLPNNATYTALQLKNGYIPHWDGNAWKQVEDHKGEPGYLNGEAHTIKDYGPYPPGFSKTPPPPTVEEVKRQAITALREKRKAIEYGGVEIDGVKWDSAEKDELRLNSVMKLFESGALASYDGWKVGEGVYITLTPELLQQATLAFMRHYGRCFAVEATKLAEIDAFNTPEEVETWMATKLEQHW